MTCALSLQWLLSRSIRQPFLRYTSKKFDSRKRRPNHISDCLAGEIEQQKNRSANNISVFANYFCFCWLNVRMQCEVLIYSAYARTHFFLLFWYKPRFPDQKYPKTKNILIVQNRLFLNFKANKRFSMEFNSSPSGKNIWGGRTEVREFRDSMLVALISSRLFLRTSRSFLSCQFFARI